MVNTKRMEMVAREAARLRYDNPEEYREYITAKKEAARRLCMDGYLPPNSLIHKYYHEIADVYEGQENREGLLREMREEALYWMEMLRDFNPRVIGSVERGDVTHKSDIDLHVFVEDNHEEVLSALEQNDIKYDYFIEPIKEEGEKKLYHHVYAKHKFNCEISIYLKSEYKPQTCSIFGTPIKGWNIKKLKKVLLDKG